MYHEDGLYAAVSISPCTVATDEACHETPHVNALLLAYTELQPVLCIDYLLLVGLYRMHVSLTVRPMCERQGCCEAGSGMPVLSQ